jgi:hypothetical protein
MWLSSLHLTQLGLDRTQVTNACIPHLKRMKTLQIVEFLETDVTYPEMIRLQRVLPDACDLPHRRATAELRSARVPQQGRHGRIDASRHSLTPQIALAIRYYHRPPETVVLGYPALADASIRTLLRLKPDVTMNWYLKEVSLTDEQMALLAEYDKIGSVRMIRCRFSEEGFAELGKLDRIDSLSVWSCELKGKWLARLSDVDLRFFTISSGDASWSDLEYLPTTIERLRIHDLRKDETGGLEVLRRFPKLNDLMLGPLEDTLDAEAAKTVASIATLERVDVNKNSPKLFCRTLKRLSPNLRILE